MSNLASQSHFRPYPLSVADADPHTATPDIAQRFRDFIRSEEFPCVGAKSALVRDALSIVHLRDFDSAQDDLDLYRALCEFGETTLDVSGPIVQSFVAIFDSQQQQLTEKTFEHLLWNRLQSLHNIDVAAGNDWSADTASDPNSPHFSLCIAGQAYFVIGLHPGASRAARRFENPTLVFNSHEQFEKLRTDGRYAKMQKIIRKRDSELDGSINPMVQDFGLGSEAAQYSGRHVNPRQWSCPFAKKDVA